ncbi:MAG TPA: hypothetical protein VD994_11795 [Prosthecobacter sp.]|nr:hypothetical protein [Prosthecobacter sp.]
MRTCNYEEPKRKSYPDDTSFAIDMLSYRQTKQSCEEGAAGDRQAIQEEKTTAQRAAAAAQAQAAAQEQSKREMRSQAAQVWTAFNAQEIALWKQAKPIRDRLDAMRSTKTLPLKEMLVLNRDASAHEGREILAVGRIVPPAANGKAMVELFTDEPGRKASIQVSGIPPEASQAEGPQLWRLKVTGATTANIPGMGEFPIAGARLIATSACTKEVMVTSSRYPWLEPVPCIEQGLLSLPPDATPPKPEQQ